jgi:hypothetical protein
MCEKDWATNYVCTYVAAQKEYSLEKIQHDFKIDYE